MRKKDLKSGMLVELKSGVVGLVVGECVIFSNKKQPLGLEYLTDDMKNKNEFNDFFDIIKVSNVKKWSGLWEGYWILENITNDLLWEREEKEMVEIDGVEYELDMVKKALDMHKTMDKAINPEEPKEEKRQKKEATANSEYWRIEYINLMDKYGSCTEKMKEFDKWLDGDGDEDER